MLGDHRDAATGNRAPLERGYIHDRFFAVFADNIEFHALGRRENIQRRTCRRDACPLSIFHPLDGVVVVRGVVME